MAKATFTARWVETVASPASGQVDYFDTKPPGVGLRVSSQGRKTWFVMYRSAGRLRRYTLGVYPVLSLADAREQALAVRYQVTRGDDPALAKTRGPLVVTVAQLAAAYLERYAKVHKRSWRIDAAWLAREVIPRWGARPADTITRREVIALGDAIVERGAPMSANRVLDTVRKMYNWAISRDMVERNPCLQVPHPGKGRARDRVLSAAEVRALWVVCGTLPAQYRVPIQFQLLTAQRMGEVRTMRWEDLDLRAGWWTIPAAVAKNGLSHRVPLSPPALDLLTQRYFQCGVHPYVFPSPRVPGVPLSREAVSKVFTALTRREQVPWVLHDLRRTAASHMAGLGISRLVISKLLNHVEPGMTKVYDRHSYDSEKRQALELWGQYLMALVRGTEAPKVVPLRRGA